MLPIRWNGHCSNGTMLLRTLAIVVLGVVSAFAQPAEILVFRHAEKPLDDTNPHLSNRGRERAAALAFYITANPVCTNFGSPVAIFAADATTDAPSQRTTETVTPLSEKIGVPIQTPFSADQYHLLAQSILTNADFAGKTVVICWPHDQIPSLAHSLGISRPPTWRASTFDRVWAIRYNTGRARLFNIPERLMFGDSIH